MGCIHWHASPSVTPFFQFEGKKNLVAFFFQMLNISKVMEENVLLFLWGILAFGASLELFVGQCLHFGELSISWPTLGSFHFCNMQPFQLFICLLFWYPDHQEWMWRDSLLQSFAAWVFYGPAIVWAYFSSADTIFWRMLCTTDSLAGYKNWHWAVYFLFG